MVGWPWALLFFTYTGPQEKVKSLKKSLYNFFVELGRRAWVWEAYLRGGGIILTPTILLMETGHPSTRADNSGRQLG